MIAILYYTRLLICFKILKTTFSCGELSADTLPLMHSETCFNNPFVVRCTARKNSRTALISRSERARLSRSLGHPAAGSLPAYSSFLGKEEGAGVKEYHLNIRAAQNARFCISLDSIWPNDSTVGILRPHECMSSGSKQSRSALDDFCLR